MTSKIVIKMTMFKLFLKALIIMVKLIMACIIMFYGFTNNIPMLIGIIIVIPIIKYATYFYQRELLNYKIITSIMLRQILHHLSTIDNPVSTSELTIYTIRYINEIINEYNLGDTVNVNICSMFPNQSLGLAGFWVATQNPEQRIFKAFLNALLYGSPYIHNIRLLYKSDSAITITVFKTWTGYKLHYFHLSDTTYDENYHNDIRCPTLDELKGQIIDVMFIPEEMKSPSPLIKSGYKCQSQRSTK